MVYENIRNLREDRDLRQSDVAKALNVSQSTYAKYEKGQISITAEVLIALSKYYLVSVDDILNTNINTLSKASNIVNKTLNAHQSLFSPDLSPEGNPIFTRFTTLRKQHNITQQEIANLLNIKQSTYSKYERGALPIPIEVFIRLANHYNVSIDYLVGRTDS